MIYRGILTTARRSDALERTLLALRGCPWEWTVHEGPSINDRRRSNRLGYEAMWRAALATGAEWLLALEDDTEPVAGIPWTAIEDVLTAARRTWRTHYVYFGDRRQRHPGGRIEVAGVPCETIDGRAWGLQCWAAHRDLLRYALRILPTVIFTESALYAGLVHPTAGIRLVTPWFVERRGLEPTLLGVCGGPALGLQTFRTLHA